MNRGDSMDKYEQEQQKQVAIDLANMTFVLFTELYKKTNNNMGLTLNLVTCVMKAMLQKEKKPSLNILWNPEDKKGE